ncbi:MAG: carboxypeptidase regulatory-like domain-containing protein [Muribaculaceae bacterium]|nr:carboxypeptidase regulatory-like domain-containing protein [Muribaculaceae bacterium]
MNKLCLISILLIAAFNASADDFVSIAGKVTDYKGNNVDSCYVCLYNPDFSMAYETYSDAEGHYRLDSIAKGHYACLAALRLKEYPRMQQVEKKDMKLEFWAWNVPANRDIRLNIRYDKLELYGTTAFFEFGGRQELLIYTRPMSVTKVLEDPGFMDKTSQEKNWKVTVEPKQIEFEVYADGNRLKIISVQHLSLPNTNGNPNNDDCYLIHTSMPENIHKHHDEPCEIRVIGHNIEYDEWGENVYYLTPVKYSSNK